jgi:hypothetical protein
MVRSYLVRYGSIAVAFVGVTLSMRMLADAGLDPVSTIASAVAITGVSADSIYPLLQLVSVWVLAVAVARLVYLPWTRATRFAPASSGRSAADSATSA